MKKYNVGIIYPGEREFYNYSLKLPNSSNIQDVLEKTFNEWNAGSGQECKEFIESKARSLNKNDIVIINDTYYQCMSYGWNVVSREYIIKLENDVYNLIHNNPKYKDNPWEALQEIMHQRTVSEKTVFDIIR